VRVGPYEVFSEVGSGGAGLVYRARSPEGRDVVVKVVRETGEKAYDAFERETRLVGRLADEDGFVPILTAGRDGGRFYVVLPFLPGGTLADRIGRLAPDDAIAIVLALARAAGRAHSRGIVHRDLKPENILFTANGEPRIADLGLAKVLGPDPRSLSVTGMVSGTAGYMAPEQLADAKNVSAAADVFALGVILVEAVTGRRPFGDPGSIVEYALMLAKKPALGGLPARLVPIAARALARDPRARYPDGVALARALAAPRSSKPFVAVAAVLAVASLALAAVVARTVSSRVPLPVTSDDASEKLSAEAEACLATGDTTRAIALATRARDLAARPARALEIRAAALFCGGEPSKALEDAKRAVALEPQRRTPLAWVVRSIVAESEGDLAREIEADTHALDLDPRLAVAWTRRSEARDMKGDRDGALSDATRAIEVCGGLALAWLDRATLRCRNEDLDGAIDDVTRSIGIAPGIAASWSVRAACKAKRKDHAGVLADLTRAIELDPTRPGDWANRAMAHRGLGDPRAGIDDASKAIELDARVGQAWFHRAGCRADLGDTKGAVADLIRALELDPELAPRARTESFIERAPDSPATRRLRRLLEEHR
jgi:tetratricopeptide (TPR) repeat protein